MIDKKTFLQNFQKGGKYFVKKREPRVPAVLARMPPISLQRGQAVLITVIFFLAGSFIIMVGMSLPVAAEIQIARNLLDSKKSFFFSEGAMEDAVFRLKQNLPLSSPEIVLFPDGDGTITHVATVDGKDITSEGDRDDRIRVSQVSLIEGIGGSFSYGMQSDVGGILMENSSSIVGNAYSNGPIQGSGSSLIEGEAISAGPSGLVAGVHATGTVWSHIINDSIVDKDAYYGCDTCISNTTVGGTEFSNRPDQPQASLPISDSVIEQWEQDAEAGGIISSPCPYIIDSDVTIGPVKITCDLLIRMSPDVTFAGAVWVVGNIRLRNTPSLYVDPSLIGKSVPIIADNPADRETSSKIDIENANGFFGAGAQSFIFMASQNSSSENGGSEAAITVENSASGDLLVYAAHGEILLKNNVDLREVTAYKIHLRNSAQIIYDTGLASTLFTAGPSGGFVIGGWGESE